MLVVAAALGDKISGIINPKLVVFVEIIVALDGEFFNDNWLLYCSFYLCWNELLKAYATTVLLSFFLPAEVVAAIATIAVDPP